MIYLLSEIVIGLIIMGIASFSTGWILRGIQERIRKQTIKD